MIITKLSITKAGDASYKISGGGFIRNVRMPSPIDNFKAFAPWFNSRTYCFNGPQLILIDDEWLQGMVNHFEKVLK